MNKDIHVYCTHCKNFNAGNLDINGEPMPMCIYADRCYFFDWEDSRPFEERPYFEEK